MLDETLVAEIVRRIRGVARPDRVILFGSAAAGQMTRDSDIDLLVLEARPGDPRRESVRLGDALRGLGHPFDVIVMATERFEESKSVIGGLAYPAHRYGKVIYAGCHSERSEESRCGCHAERSKASDAQRRPELGLP
jgi:predicted nucleotidyltransferase